MDKLWRVNTLLLFLFWYIAAGDELQTTKNLSVSVGSPLFLPGPNGCLDSKDLSYELKYEEKIAGWYDDGKLHPLGQFKGRLEFSNQTCTFIVMNLSLKYTGMYMVTARWSENSQSEITTYNITVLDLVTSMPFASLSGHVNSSLHDNVSDGGQVPMPIWVICIIVLVCLVAVFLLICIIYCCRRPRKAEKVNGDRKAMEVDKLNPPENGCTSNKKEKSSLPYV